MKSFYKKIIRNYNSNINANDIKIIKTTKHHDLPDYTKKFAWGSYHTDHMLEIDYDQKLGWSQPLISEYHNLSIDPRNQTLHYAIELFEGLKAFRNNKDVYLFRPDLNMKRMNMIKYSPLIGSASIMRIALGIAPIYGPKNGITFVTPTITLTSTA